MKISNIKFNFFTETGVTKAGGTVRLGDAFTINFTLKYAPNKEVFFVSLGNDKQGKNQKWYKSVTQLSESFESKLVDAIVKAYNKQHNAVAKVQAKTAQEQVSA